MPMPDFTSVTNAVDRDREYDTLSRGFLARLQLLEMSAERIAKEFRERAAESLIACGITLIPSDHLQDHQFCVSRGVYDAATKACKAKGLT